MTDWPRGSSPSGAVALPLRGRSDRLGEGCDVDVVVMPRVGNSGHGCPLYVSRLVFPRRLGGEPLCMGRSAERAAENESIFRDANERIEDRLGELTLQDGRSPFLCECEDLQCREIVRLTREEYESVRSQPNRFFIAHGHPFTEAHVIAETERFHVVEKTGRAGEVAEDLDPRSNGK